jgi:molybdate transport system substrate-binding protein
MSAPVKELQPGFEKDTGITVDLTLGGTETLLPQVELGVPADVFIGHAPFADLLKEKGLREDRLVILGALRPTVVVAKGNPKKILSLKDLTREDVQVGLPDARYATCGQFFETAATQLQLLDAIRARTVYTSRTHQELATALRTGAVDVIVCWNFIAAQQREEFDAVPIGVDFPSAEIFATMLKKAPAPEAAKRFLDFLDADAAKQAFAKLGYGNVLPTVKEAAKKTLKLYCAAGVQKPVDELVDLFKSRHAGVEFEVVYQGSGTLLAQIALSKTGDLYIAGDEVFMDQAREKGLIARAQRMAVFTPVVAVPKGNPQHVASFEDLAKAGVRVGLGDEKAAAVGGASVRLLTRLGIWPGVQKNIAVTAGTVDQLAIQTSLGNLDASIIWDATAWQFKERVEVVARGDTESQVGVPIGILRFTQNEALADEFVRLATSPEAADILKKHGLQPTRGK